jgi:hypothetical protein
MKLREASSLQAFETCCSETSVESGWLHNVISQRIKLCFQCIESASRHLATNDAFVSGGRSYVEQVGRHFHSLGQCIPSFFLSRTPWLSFSFMSTPSLHYPLPSLKKVFIFLKFLDSLNNQTTQINLTFIGFYFWFYILQFITICYNSSLTQDRNK